MAVTRARRHLVVVCDSQTVRNHDFLRSLVDYMSEHGEVRTAFEYIKDLVPENYHRDFKDEQNNIKASSTKTKTRSQQGKRSENKQNKASESNSKANGQAKDDAYSSKSKGDNQVESQIKKDELRQQLLLFLDNQSQTELQFPASLNSHERLLVHQLCEELGLKHMSKGTGKERHITVSKPVTEPEERLEEESESTKPEIVIPEEQMESQIQPLKPAVDLKSLHLERMRREQEKREEKMKIRRQEMELKDSKGTSTKKIKGTVPYSGNPQMNITEIFTLWK